MVLRVASLAAHSPSLGRDADGRIVNIAPTWSVVGNGGAITPDGMFTAGAVSGAGGTVAASAQGISSRASITVAR